MIYPKIVNIELTNHCNAKCIMCPNKAMKRIRGMMTSQIFMTAIDKLSLIGEIENIQLQGLGESFLHPDIEKFAKYAKERCKNKIISIITNGSLINQISDYFDYVVVSFNAGNKQIYEEIMNLNFDDVVNRIKNIKDKNKLFLTMVVSNLNADSREEFEKLWEGYKYGMNKAYYNWLGNIEYNGMEELPKTNKICNRLFLHLSILWDGAINLCCQDYECNIKLGNILRDNVEFLYNNDIINKIREEHTKGIYSDICSNCNYRLWEGYERN